MQDRLTTLRFRTGAIVVALLALSSAQVRAQASNVVAYFAQQNGANQVSHDCGSPSNQFIPSSSASCSGTGTSGTVNASVSAGQASWHVWANAQVDLHDYVSGPLSTHNVARVSSQWTDFLRFTHGAGVTPRYVQFDLQQGGQYSLVGTLDGTTAAYTQGGWLLYVWGSSGLNNDNQSSFFAEADRNNPPATKTASLARSQHPLYDYNQSLALDLRTYFNAVAYDGGGFPENESVSVNSDVVISGLHVLDANHNDITNQMSYSLDSDAVNTAPEPSSLVLTGSAIMLAGLSLSRRRRPSVAATGPTR